MRYQSIQSRRQRQRRDCAYTAPHCLIAILYGWYGQQHGTGVYVAGRERRIWSYRTA